MKYIFNKKFPDRILARDRFLSMALLTLELIPPPAIETLSEAKIRDIKDRPVLRAALNADVDIILTGIRTFWSPPRKTLKL